MASGVAAGGASKLPQMTVILDTLKVFVVDSIRPGRQHHLVSLNMANARLDYTPRMHQSRLRRRVTCSITRAPAS